MSAVWWGGNGIPGPTPSGSFDGTIRNAYATGDVSGVIGGGGLAGTNGFLLPVGPTTTIKVRGRILDAYATGAVPGRKAGIGIGGLVGLNLFGRVRYGYYDSTTTGQAHGTQADGSVGLTTLEWLTQGPVATGTFDTTTTWVAGYPYPVLKALPYVLITADGTEVYNSGTANITIASITDQNGNDTTGLVGNTSGISWLTSASTNSPTGTYVLGGTGATVLDPHYQLTYIGTLAVTASSSNSNNSGTYSPRQYEPSGNGNSGNTPSTNVTFQNSNNSNTPTITTVTQTASNTNQNASQNIATGSGPNSLFPLISQFDQSQYTKDKLPDFAPQAGEAAVLTMIARAEENNRAAPKINALWQTNTGEWPTGDSVLKNVSFSDGSGHGRTPNGNNGFPFKDGTTDIAAMLQHGPVALGGAASGGQPPTTPWLLALKLTADGKGIIANDPLTGDQVILAYNPATKTVGGVTAVIDPKTGKPVPLGNGAPKLTGQKTKVPDSAWPELKAFTPTSYFAVSI